MDNRVLKEMVTKEYICLLYLSSIQDVIIILMEVKIMMRTAIIGHLKYFLIIVVAA